MELSRNIKELKKYQNLTPEKLTDDLTRQWAVLHGIQLSIQAVIDVGGHIISSTGENNIYEYADVIERLGKKEIIPAAFAARIVKMVGLRNILVHEYAEVDMKKVVNVLKNHLQDFTDFAKYISIYLKKK